MWETRGVGTELTLFSFIRSVESGETSYMKEEKFNSNFLLFAGEMILFFTTKFYAFFCIGTRIVVTCMCRVFTQNLYRKPNYTHKHSHLNIFLGLPTQIRFVFFIYTNTYIRAALLFAQKLRSSGLNIVTHTHFY